MVNTTREDVTGGHEANFARYANRGSKDECWAWTGPHDRYGYATSQIMESGRNTRTGGHRVAYLLLRGPVPLGLVLDHLCRNRWCVNPWHLEIVTNHENTLRQRRSGVCRSGRHQMTPDNTYEHRSGIRRCRACMREGFKRANAKRPDRAR